MVSGKVLDMWMLTAKGIVRERLSFFGGWWIGGVEEEEGVQVWRRQGVVV